MKKIYNNLNIENLIKTEWINQFNKYQQEEITKGIEDNLDVSIYAKKEFNRDQMREIKEGLKANLDVFIYAKPEIPWREMETFRERLSEEKSTL